MGPWKRWKIGPFLTSILDFRDGKMTLLILGSDVNTILMYLYLHEKVQGDIHLLNWSNCAWKWGKYLQISHWLQCANQIGAKNWSMKSTGVAFFGLSGSQSIFCGFWGDSEGSFLSILGHNGRASLACICAQKGIEFLLVSREFFLGRDVSHSLYPLFFCVNNKNHQENRL